MTVPTNTPRGSYGPKGDTPPVVPWLGVAAAPPAIPKLYWDAYSDEQRIKALWACFNGLAERVNQLGYYYLPDFQGEWDRTKEYPPLSVVSAPAGIDNVTAGDSYTALDWVPVGTPLTDTTYWAKTGNYNADVSSKAPKYHASAESIYGLGTSALNGHVKLSDDSSNGTAVGVHTFNDQFAKKTDSLFNVEAVAVGDSITRGYGLSQPSMQSWAAVLSDMMGWTLHNYAVDGTSFAGVGASFINQLNDAAADGTFSNDNIKVVVIGGGINDHSNDIGSIPSAVVNTINTAHTNFPNALVFVMPNLCAAHPLDIINQGDGKYIHSLSSQAVLNALATYNGQVTYLSDAFRLLTGHPEWAQDEVHPNAQGAGVIAKAAYNVLVYGNATPPTIQVFTLEPDSAISSKIDVFHGAVYNDGKEWAALIHLKFLASQSISIGEKLCDLPSPLCLGTFLLDSINIATAYASNNTATAATFFKNKNTIFSYSQFTTISNCDFYIRFNGITGLT